MKNYFLFAAFSLSVYASAQLSTYSYYREIKPVNETGFYNIKLGSSVLDRPGSYRLYRLSAKDTVEVPYVSESRSFDIYDRKYFRNLRLIDKTFEPGKASYTTLVIDTPLTYNSIYLDFNAPEFFKEVTVEGSNDNKGWKVITENEKLFHYYREPGDHYYRNKIVLGPVTFKYLRVKMDDTDGSRLDVTSARLPLIKEQAIEEDELIPSELSRTENKKDKQTAIELRFKRPYLVTELQLSIDNEDKFRRNASLYLYKNISGKDNWIYYGSTVFTSSSSNKVYINNYRKDDEGFKSDRLRIVIDNLDNQPLEKISAQAFTHYETLKAKLERSARYVLAYGKDTDTAPQYDLEYFKNSIPLNLANADLGNEKQIDHAPVTKPEPLLKNKMWIWIALIGCVLVIGLFTIKLLKAEK